MTQSKAYLQSSDGVIDAAYIRRKLTASGIVSGDTVMVSCRLPFLGALASGATFNDFSSCLIHEGLGLIGPKGTMVVPAYSYTFCKKQEFNVLTTPSTLGDFFESFRQMSGVRRVPDPIFSVSVIGKNADFLLGGRHDDCFGKDSFFDRFHSLDVAKYVLIGLNYHYITNFHHIEQVNKITYRFIKEFPGVIVMPDGTRAERIQKYFVRHLDQSYDFEPLFKYIAEHSLGQSLVFGNTFIKTIEEKVFFEAVTQLLKRDEKFFLKR